jgi:alanyl aminopeptidase
LPNHQASGYYRWKLARPQTANLINARHELSQFEQLALTDSLSAGFYSGAYSFDDVSDWLMRFTDSPNRYVATSVFPIMEFAKSHLLTGSRRETVLSKAAARFRPILLQPIDVLFRHELLSFLAFVVEDPQTRSNLSVIGRLNLHKRDNYNIASIALGVLAQDHSSNVVTLSNQLTSSTSPIDRQTILSAISRVGRAHADVFYDILLGSSLKKSERLHLLVQHASHDPNSGPAWLWLQNHWDDYLSLLPNEVKGALPAVASSLCQMSDRESVQAFFATHDIKDFSGGPRSLSEAMEQIDLCSAIRNYSLLAQ